MEIHYCIWHRLSCIADPAPKHHLYISKIKENTLRASISIHFENNERQTAAIVIPVPTAIFIIRHTRAARIYCC